MYVNDLVKPVLSCFFDSDSRVRYYGCESLYNIVKVARSAVLPFFNDIFDGLSKVGVVVSCISFLEWSASQSSMFRIGFVFVRVDDVRN